MTYVYCLGRPHWAGLVIGAFGVFITASPVLACLSQGCRLGLSDAGSRLRDKQACFCWMNVRVHDTVSSAGECETVGEYTDIVINDRIIPRLLSMTRRVLGFLHRSFGFEKCRNPSRFVFRSESGWTEAVATENGCLDRKITRAVDTSKCTGAYIRYK